MLVRLQDTTAEIRVRFAVLLLVAFTVLAERFGLESILGAFPAGAIVDLVGPTASDLVVEIGPGEGALTAELARRAGRVIALEVDPALAARLRSSLPGVEIVEADARGWDYGTRRGAGLSRERVARRSASLHASDRIEGARAFWASE